MLNDENVSVEMSKLDSEINKDRTNDEVEKKKKKKKKVHFSDKNETIYYEKDETEHNANFGIAFNSFNYFECFYNKLYNYDFDEKDVDAEFSQSNEEEEEGDAASYFDFRDGTIYGKTGELENDLEMESEGKEKIPSGNTQEEMDGKKETIKDMVEVRRKDEFGRDIDREITRRVRQNNSSAVQKNGSVKVSEFTQSFNEDSSFEINNIKKAIFDAEEKTSSYNKEYFGYEIDPFNMKNELKEGYIDKFGNYIYHEEYDNDEIEEAWLKSVDEQDPLSTFSSERLKNKLHKEIYAKYDEENKNTKDYYQTVNIYDALFSLCALLIEKETPLKAMVRYKADLQACKKILVEYKQQIEQFSATHACLMNGGIGINRKEEKNECKGAIQNAEDEKHVQVSNKEKKEDVQEKNDSHEDRDTGDIEEKKKLFTTEKKEKENKTEEEMDKAEENQSGETSEIEIHKRETNETEKEEETNKDQHKETREFLNRKSIESIHEVMNDNTVKDQKQTDVDLSENTSHVEVAISNKETNGEIKCETIQGSVNEEVWREYQHMLGVYQKLELDYKTIERRFNNLIDLTQKLTYEYKNVYFLTKGEFEKLYKKLEEYKENIEIKWQFKWSNDSEDNAYGPYNYTDIYQWISVGYVSAINPIHLRRINKENEVIENIWQMYDAINYLIFVSNENVKKKRKLDEMNVNISDEKKEKKGGTGNSCVSVNASASVSVSEDEDDEEEEEYDDHKEFDISNRKRKKKKGLIQISKKKAKLNKRNFVGTKEEELKEDAQYDEDEDDDDDDDDFDDYEF